MHSIRITSLALSVLACLEAGAASLPVLQEKGDHIKITSANERVMTITSSQKNNLIKWRSFDVAKDAHVFFDDRNYLNLVTGGKRSLIDGTIESFGNLYIVNPAGIRAGVNSVINAGRLGLITSPVSQDMIDGFKARGVIEAPPGAGLGRVQLLGEIKAENLIADGSQVIIRDISKIRSTSGDPLNNRSAGRVQLSSSSSRIDIGGATYAGLESDYGLKAPEVISHAGQKAVSSKDEFLAMQAEESYWLTDDLDLGVLEKPLMDGEAFKGSLDGAFNKVAFSLNDTRTDSELSIGLFSAVKGAQIKDLALEGSIASDAGWNSTAGVLAGTIASGVLDHVEIRNSDVTWTRRSSGRSAGGLAGTASGEVTLNAVSAVTGSGLADALAADSDSKAGALFGAFSGKLDASGLSFAKAEGLSDLTGNGAKIPLFYENEEQAFASLTDKERSGYALVSGHYSDTRFYDRFVVKNFKVAEGSYESWADLASGPDFDPGDYFGITEIPQKSDLYETHYRITQQQDLEEARADGALRRQVIFESADADGSTTLSAEGEAIVWRGERPAPEPEPEPDPQPEPAPDPDPAPDPQPAPDPEPSPDPAPAPSPAPQPHHYADDHGGDHYADHARRSSSERDPSLRDHTSRYDLPLIRVYSGKAVLKAPALRPSLLAQARQAVARVYAALNTLPGQEKLPA